MNFDWYAYEWSESEKKGFNCYSQIKLLKTDGDKEKHKLLVYGKNGIKNEKTLVSCYSRFITEMLGSLESLSLKKPTIDIKSLPPFSFFLQFTFKLATSYISKDDEVFYICDNHIKKDKVFKVPMVSGSTWKGNMRWTAGRLLEMNTDINERFKKRVQISNLFGNENEAEERYFDSLMPEKKDDFKMIMRNPSNKEGLRRGRLNFYPTFFDKISLEVINPHDRKTKAGTVPIYIESVPDGATGTFSLLYVPFDLMGKLSGEIKKQVTGDINMVSDSLKEMMLTYGFSAKKSSGFGVAEKDIKGIFEMSGNKDKQAKQEPVKPEITKKKTYSTFSELLSSRLPTNQSNSETFSSFLEMRDYIEKVEEEIMKNDR
ncbi:RAMP superfamily CRISPR-associated protein [uncultured Candidatus Kuenenia sp.]|uniref:RAMP superfamily CRISPR-associated protein n=1 Tax=uncultured Candidatus Kuenenia sp. TaxID=1048336 RepID=UPI0002D5C6CF|nr:RAMP superfamily CRISPR-associated protein [uncultured Candidatus Kuenenia sp.]